jgi:hypothetical protein
VLDVQVAAPHTPLRLGQRSCERGDSLLIVRPNRSATSDASPSPSGPAGHSQGLAIDAVAAAARLPAAAAAAHVIEAL